MATTKKKPTKTEPEDFNQAAFRAVQQATKPKGSALQAKSRSKS